MIEKGRMLFTSESVTEGHPDKMADQISDSILDAILKEDPKARVACETMLTTGLVVLAGEITTSTYVDFQKLVRETIKEIGYDRAKYGFDAETCGVISAIHEQSPDIAMGVDEALESKKGTKDESIENVGAGDQGLMFGYATNETEELMPMPIMLAHKLARKLSEVRKDKTLGYLRPDGKTQVTVEYLDGKPVRIDTIVVSTQHDAEVTHEQIEKDIKEFVINAKDNCNSTNFALYNIALPSDILEKSYELNRLLVISDLSTIFLFHIIQNHGCFLSAYFSLTIFS